MLHHELPCVNFLDIARLALKKRAKGMPKPFDFELSEKRSAVATSVLGNAAAAIGAAHDGRVTTAVPRRPTGGGIQARRTGTGRWRGGWDGGVAWEVL